MVLSMLAKFSTFSLVLGLAAAHAGAQTISLQGTLSARSHCADDGRWPFEKAHGCTRLALPKDRRCVVTLEARGGEMRSARIFVPGASELSSNQGVLELTGPATANVMNTDKQTRSYTLSRKPHSIEVDFKLNRDFRPTVATRFNVYLNHRFQQNGKERRRSWIEYNCVNLKPRR